MRVTCQRNHWSTHVRGRVRGVQLPGDSLEELLPAVLDLPHVRRVTVIGAVEPAEYEAFEARLDKARPEISLQWMSEPLLSQLSSEL